MNGLGVKLSLDEEQYKQIETILRAQKVDNLPPIDIFQDIPPDFQTGFTDLFNEAQREAFLRTGKTSLISVIDGPPGCGKMASKHLDSVHKVHEHQDWKTQYRPGHRPKQRATRHMGAYVVTNA